MRKALVGIAGFLSALLLVVADAAAQQQCGTIADPQAQVVEQVLLNARPSSCGQPRSDEGLAICRGIDLARTFTGRSDCNRFAYSETDGFDRQLSASMRTSKNKVITVTNLNLTRSQVERFRDITPDSQRVLVWLSRVEETRGTVILCTRQSNGELQSVLGVVLDWLFGWLNRWALYRPARDYHARVIVAPVVGQDSMPVESIEFVRRNQVSGAFTCAWRPR